MIIRSNLISWCNLQKKDYIFFTCNTLCFNCFLKILISRPPATSLHWKVRWNQGARGTFLITRLALSNPWNHFVVVVVIVVSVNFLVPFTQFQCFSSRFHFKPWHVSEFYHLVSYWIWTSLDMFKNRINSYHIESEQV